MHMQNSSQIAKGVQEQLKNGCDHQHNSQHASSEDRTQDLQLTKQTHYHCAKPAMRLAMLAIITIYVTFSDIQVLPECSSLLLMRCLARGRLKTDRGASVHRA